MMAAAQGLVPAPRPSPEQPQPVPFRLPWSRTRSACRPAIGDALLLQYPEVAKALAAGTSDKTAGEVRSGIIADVAAAGGGA
jgi:hypothetical protein